MSPALLNDQNEFEISLTMACKKRKMVGQEPRSQVLCHGGM